ncbi:MAG: transcriptional repressor LexA [Dissulfurispiraceae bacterium]
MAKSISADSLQERADKIRYFYASRDRMPSYSEIAGLLGFNSKSSVFKLIAKLEQKKYLLRDESGRLIPGQMKHSLRVLGTVEAGFPSPAEEELADTLSLDDLLIKNPQATFLLKVSGDSMSEAGILPGDMVIIDRSLEPKNGDVVIAEVDGAWTMKYLDKQGTDVMLRPANQKYKPIKPTRELKIAGVVTSVIRKYQ